MQFCLICNKKFEGQRPAESLSKHLNYHIGKDIVDKQDYYDRFFGNPNDKICHNENCNNPVKFKSITLGYQKFCSAKCNRSCDETKEKQKQTMLDRYGISHNFSGKHGSRQCDITLNERYGVSSPIHLDIFRNKMRETNIERHGIEHNWNGIFGQRSCDITRESIMTNDEWTDRKKSGTLKKYGVDNYFKLIDKMKRHWMEHFGVENPMQHPDIFQKSHSSQMRKSYRLKKYQTKYGNIVKFQSKLELSFIQFCENNDIEIFDGDCIWYIIDGKRHRYFVDFKIKISNNYQLVELKGMHPWYYEHTINGLIDIKNSAAIEYSIERGYLPFIYFVYDGENKNNFGLGSINAYGVE